MLLANAGIRAILHAHPSVKSFMRSKLCVMLIGGIRNIRRSFDVRVSRDGRLAFRTAILQAFFRTCESRSQKISTVLLIGVGGLSVEKRRLRLA